jgi:hypothetical protein
MCQGFVTSSHFTCEFLYLNLAYLMSIDFNPRHSPRNASRFLEAVIVCVDYADFLEATLHHNKQFFDHVVVVTSFADKATQNVCRYNNIECIKTDSFYEDGASFNKANGINLGFAHLKYNDWILHLDADVLLPNDFRNLVWAFPLQRDCVYGADRFNIIGRKQYNALISSKDFHHQYKHKFLSVAPQPAERGARLIHREFGYCPIGFFQLFNSYWIRTHDLRYPNNQQNAERSDVLFSLQWPREKRHLIPTACVFHLESERNGQGVNWHGRKSAPFA